jgi:hypothetical protein
VTTKIKRVHPLADLFPMMGSEELAALAEDIRENGLRESIKLHEGAIVDGRNRFAACKQAGVEPRFDDVNGSEPLDVVISANVKRRKMLTVGQRAIAAAEAWPLVGGKAQGRRTDLTSGGDRPRFSRAEMARRWEIGETALKEATALVEPA